MANVNALLKSAMNETSHLVSGEVFIVRDLFKGYEWNRIPIGDRLLLGTLFLMQIDSNNQNSQNGITIVPDKKTSSGQQKYRVL